MGEMSAIAANPDSVGDVLGALRAAVAANHAARSAELERLIIALRARAYAAQAPTVPRADWPPAYPDPAPGLHGIPQIDAAQLDVATLGGAIMHHGLLHVRGLLNTDQASVFQDGIDRAFAGRDANRAGADLADLAPWYAHAPEGPYTPNRHWVEDGGGVWTADSPRVMFDLIEMFEKSGITAMIADFLGERPALSIGKSTLRRVPPVLAHGLDPDWHQDGAFLGADVRSINVWIAVSDCGSAAPGMEVIGERLPYVLQSGSHGAHFDWAVGPGMVDLLAQGGAPVEIPQFRAGDALIFDHLMLHRTSVRPGMVLPRWAIESWFFAPSTYPMDQGPLYI